MAEEGLEGLGLRERAREAMLLPESQATRSRDSILTMRMGPIGAVLVIAWCPCITQARLMQVLQRAACSPVNWPQEGKVTGKQLFGLKMVSLTQLCNLVALLLWDFKMLLSLVRVTRSPNPCEPHQPHHVLAFPSELQAGCGECFMPRDRGASEEGLVMLPREGKATQKVRLR
jgi:hypothetical protein